MLRLGVGDNLGKNPSEGSEPTQRTSWAGILMPPDLC